MRPKQAICVLAALAMVLSMTVLAGDGLEMARVKAEDHDMKYSDDGGIIFQPQYKTYYRKSSPWPVWTIR